ncbi:hypothetical protein [Variovorax sp.]|uniref:hypothetical protein n=1 Tax=Variovorax sp. TaxID=1871043 RepID=UPI003BAD8B61
MSRSCDALQCGANIQPGRFLCITHWRMVPADVQRTINTRFRACRADFAFLSDIAYLEACVDAIERIAVAEGKKGQPTSYHRLLASAKRKATS